MPDLQTLLRARQSYRMAFGSKGLPIDSVEEILNDRDLKFSEHVFVANNDDRRFQISQSDDALPCAFIKRTGGNDEIELLQVVVRGDNLMLNECHALLDDWIFSQRGTNEVESLAADFGR